jgi:PAS domain S-box-containing protein
MYNPKPLLMRIMGSDITERKRTTVRELKQRLADIIDFLPDATFAVDIGGKVIAWNRAIEDMTGILKGKMVGKSGYAYAVPFFGEPRPILIDLVLQDMKEIETKYHFFRRNEDKLIAETFAPMLNQGKGAYLWGIAGPIYDSGSSIVGAIQSIRDITERKWTEDALKESEEKYRNLVERANDGITIIQEGTVRYANPALAQIWGGSFEEIVGRPFTDFIDPDEIPKVVKRYHLRMANNNVTPIYETILKRRDGAKIFAELNAGLIAFQEKPADLVIIRNITDRKRVEEELKRVQSSMRIAMDLVKLVRWEYDVETDMFAFDDQFYALYGTTAEREGGPFMSSQDYARKFIPAEDASIVSEEVSKALATTDPNFTSQVEHRIIRADGTEGVIAVRFGIVKDNKGRTIRTYGANQDITERKQADFIRERSLVRQEQLNLLQQTLLSPGKLELKLKKITDSIVEIFGADFCRIWITSPGDLCEVGCVHATVTEGPHVCRYRDRCLRLIASSGRYTHTDGEVHRRVPFGCYKIGRVASGEEHKFLTNDVQNDSRIHNREWAKEIGLVSFAGYQLRPPGENTLGVLALFSKQNITVDEDAQLDSLSNTITRFIQMARVDEELRQHRDLLEDRVKERTEELARKNAEMERFVYTVSHDLRTPLISMSGFLGFLKQDAEKGDMKRVDEDFRIVSDAITKMDKLLQDTLELSRIGRIVNPPENVPFGEIVSEALAQSSAKLSSKNVRVTVEDDLPIVQVDRMRLVEVLVNLLENSVKYMGDQPQPRIEIGKRLDCENMVLFVRDNGIGIEPIRHDKVFELFYKVDKKSEGSGAGLAIVKKIIEVHGGKIWIESDLGKGCTVCFTLEPAKPG